MLGLSAKDHSESILTAINRKEQKKETPPFLSESSNETEQNVQEQVKNTSNIHIYPYYNLNIYY